MVSGHAKATVDGTVIAETDQWEEVEGNVYFPPSAVKSEYFTETDLHTTCSWKGDASYYTIGVNGEFSSLPLCKLAGLDGVIDLSGNRQGAEERGLVLSHAQGQGTEHQGLRRLL